MESLNSDASEISKKYLEKLNRILPPKKITSCDHQQNVRSALFKVCKVLSLS